LISNPALRNFSMSAPFSENPIAINSTPKSTR